MFKIGFEKIANLVESNSSVKALGKHLHKYRRDYIMSAGAGAGVASAIGINKRKKQDEKDQTSSGLTA